MPPAACYYSVFHAARAALTVRGAQAKTHAGVIQLFGREFGPAPILGKLQRLRAVADYEPDEPAETEEALRAALEDATAFVDRCRHLVDEVATAGPDEPDPPPDL